MSKSSNVISIMQLTIKSTLFIITFLFFTTSYSQNNTTANLNDYCKEWVLVRTINDSEKSNYLSDGSEHFSLDCTTNSWVRYDSSNGSTLFGTWQITESNLELKTNGEILILKIISIDEESMLLSLNGLIFEYQRK